MRGCRNYDCSQAWEADMRGLPFFKAFIAEGHKSGALNSSLQNITSLNYTKIVIFSGQVVKNHVQHPGFYVVKLSD